MPSPIAHSVMIVFVGPLRRRGLWPAAEGRHTHVLLVLLAAALLLPDVDFVIGWLWPGTILGTHAGGTHSLATTALIAFALALAWQLCIKNSGFKVFLLLLAALWCHIFMDAVTWGGQGVAMFWPMTEARVASSIRVFYGVRHSQPWAWPLHLVTLVTEFIFAAVIVVIARRVGRTRKQDTRNSASE